MVLSLGDFNGDVGKRIDEFESIRGRNGFGARNVEGEMQLEFGDEKICITNTYFKKKRKERYHTDPKKINQRLISCQPEDTTGSI